MVRMSLSRAQIRHRENERRRDNALEPWQCVYALHRFYHIVNPNLGCGIRISCLSGRMVVVLDAVVVVAAEAAIAVEFFLLLFIAFVSLLLLLMPTILAELNNQQQAQIRV